MSVSSDRDAVDTVALLDGLPVSVEVGRVEPVVGVSQSLSNWSPLSTVAPGCTTGWVSLHSRERLGAAEGAPASRSALTASDM